MTPIEARLLAGEQITFREALYDACMHGELSEEQAREWLEGEDLEIALRVIGSGLVLERAPEYLAWTERLAQDAWASELAVRRAEAEAVP